MGRKPHILRHPRARPTSNGIFARALDPVFSPKNETATEVRWRCVNLEDLPLLGRRHQPVKSLTGGRTLIHPFYCSIRHTCGHRSQRFPSARRQAVSVIQSIAPTRHSREGDLRSLTQRPHRVDAKSALRIAWIGPREILLEIRESIVVRIKSCTRNQRIQIVDVLPSVGDPIAIRVYATRG